MTSQNEEREALNDKAKKLGIKGPLLCGLDTLNKKIAEAESAQTEEPAIVKPIRGKAPSMSVANIDKNHRTALIEELEAEDPECKYIFQAGNITDRLLKAKGMERTEHSLQGDIVCRTTKESYYAVKAARQNADYEAMKRVDAGKGIIGNLQPEPRKPRS